MAISKNKQNKLARSKQYIKEQRSKMLLECGYSKLKQKHKASQRPDMPNYKVESKYQLSDSIGNGFKKLSGAHHPDAKQFPVYEAHKSNPVLQLSFDGNQFSGGKKT